MRYFKEVYDLCKKSERKKVWILKYFLYDYVLFEAKQHWDEKRRLQRGAKYKADGLKKKVFIEQSKSKMTVPKKSIFSGASGKGMPPTQTLPVEYFVH